MAKFCPPFPKPEIWIFRIQGTSQAERQALLDECHEILHKIPGKETVIYTLTDLDDPDWIFEQVAAFGYSLSVLHMPNWWIDQKRQVLGAHPPLTKAEKAEHPNGLFSYQLEGKRYTTRGEHNCPLSPDMHTALLIALFNVLRLEAGLT